VVIVPLIQSLLPVGETLGKCGACNHGFTYYYHYLRGRNAQHTRAMKEALALGASHWQTIYKVVIHILHLG
jgi:phosphate transport system permease protein